MQNVEKALSRKKVKKFVIFLHYQTKDFIKISLFVKFSRSPIFVLTSLRVLQILPSATILLNKDRHSNKGGIAPGVFCLSDFLT